MVSYPLQTDYIQVLNNRDRIERTYHFPHEWLHIQAKLDPHRIGYFYVSLHQKKRHDVDMYVTKYWSKEQLSRYLTWLNYRNPFVEQSSLHPGWRPYVSNER